MEATENVSKMFDAAASYYARERNGSGITGSALMNCIPAAGTDNMTGPGVQKLPTTTWGGGFDANTGIAFSVGGNHYYKYSMSGGTAKCSATATDTFHTLTATGDLDGDALTSSFSLATGANADNELYHASGFYIQNETE